jgi:hypothetical protein
MKRYFTIENGLYLLAFLIGLFLRFYRLGLPALGEVEAGWALQALDIAHSNATQIGSQPGYVLLTSALFWLMGSTSFLARFLPAIAGSLLIFLPFLFRPLYEDSEWLRKAGVVMAFGLALDPGLVALSRTVGSPIPAVAFTLLTLAMIINRQWIMAGVLGGLALLSGPAFVAGLLGLLLTWGVSKLLIKVGWVNQAQLTLPEITDPKTALRTSLISLGLTILVAGLLFLRVPQGLGALVQTIPDYLSGWLNPSEVPALRLPAALLFYQYLVLLFGLVTAVRGWLAARSGLRSAYLAHLLSLWALVSFLLAFFYPARQVADLAWTLIPLWGLAALEIGRHLPSHEDQPTRLVALGLAGLVVLLIIISWLNLLTLVRMNGNPVLYGAVILGALLMAVIATVLVAMGWSYPAARMGFAWGLLVGLGLGMFSATIGLSQVRPNSVLELWSTSPAPGQIPELADTISSLSDWETGFNDQIDVLVTAESNVLRWALRSDPYVTFSTSPDAAVSPAVVITWKDQESPALAEAYRGQDLVLQWYPGWQDAVPSPLLPWLANRQAPVAQLQIVLWGRVDVFPGGEFELLELSPDQQPGPAPEEEQWVP